MEPDDDTESDDGLDLTLQDSLHLADIIISAWDEHDLDNATKSEEEERIAAMLAELYMDDHFDFAIETEEMFPEALGGIIYEIIGDIVSAPAHANIVIKLLRMAAKLKLNQWHTQWDLLLINVGVNFNNPVFLAILENWVTLKLPQDMNTQIVTFCRKKACEFMQHISKKSPQQIAQILAKPEVSGFFTAVGVYQVLFIALATRSYILFHLAKKKLNYPALKPFEKRRLLRDAIRFENIFSVQEILRDTTVLICEWQYKYTTFSRINSIPMDMSLPLISNPTLDISAFIDPRKPFALYLLAKALWPQKIPRLPVQVAWRVAECHSQVAKEISKFKSNIWRMHVSAVVAAKRTGLPYIEYRLPAVAWGKIFEFCSNNRPYQFSGYYPILDDSLFQLAARMPATQVIATAPVLFSSEASGHMFRLALEDFLAKREAAEPQRVQHEGNAPPATTDVVKRPRTVR